MRNDLLKLAGGCRGAGTERGSAVTVQGVKDKEVIAAELAGGYERGKD